MPIKRVENEAYEIKHLKVDVEVGDRKNPSGFKPKLKMKRWGGECFLDIDFAEETTEEELEEELDGKGNITKIKWKVKTATSELELEYYPLNPREFEEDGHTVKQLEDGGVEFNIILKNKPMTNKIVLPIKTKELKFYYQPELTQKEIDEGAFRPENVVGSYAVYHATRTNMHRTNEDAEKYKCSKAFHIYRPKIVDSDGWEVWGKLNIDESALTVTIPQDFIDNAIYPIRHAAGATFGYETLGTVGKTSLSGNIVGSIFTITEAGTADSITAGLILFSATVTAKTKCAIYKHSDLSLVGVTEERTIAYPFPAAWYTFNFSAPKPSLTASTEYILVAWASIISGDGNPRLVYDDGDTNQGLNQVIAYNDFPNPLVPSSYADRKHSIYCTYTTALPTGLGSQPLSKGGIGRPHGGRLGIGGGTSFGG